MNTISFNKIRQLLGCLFFVVAVSCSHADPPITNTDISTTNLQANNKMITNVVSQIQPADIITRTGNDYTSQSLKTLNRKDKTFSHCGIATIENDSVFVYHSIGGDYNPNQKIKRDFINDFITPKDNNTVGLCRYNFTPKQKQALIKQALQFYQNKLSFDMDFDLASNDKMYCTEYVFKCLLYGVKDFKVFNISQIGSKKFIGVDDIVLHPLSKLIIMHNYKF